MSYRQHTFSQKHLRPNGRQSIRAWCLLWLLPFLWSATLGEVLHHYVELPASYHCAAAEFGTNSLDSAQSESGKQTAKIGSHNCHSHHSHGTDNCSSCRYITRLGTPVAVFTPTLTSQKLSSLSANCKVRFVAHRGIPVRGPPSLEI